MKQPAHARHRTAAQQAATAKWAAAGRRAQKGRARTAAQKQAALRWAAAGRAAQKAKRAGKAPAKTGQARGLALAEGVACCPAEALAVSLRLAGAAVGDDDTEALFWLAGGDPETGAPIVAVLEASAESGLAGYRPVNWTAWPRVIRRYSVFHQAAPDEALNLGNCELLGDAFGHQRFDDTGARAFPPEERQVDYVVVGDVGAFHGISVILGVDLPGPHAVTVDERGRWWSWGRPYDPASFPDAVIEEAWAVTWDG